MTRVSSGTLTVIVFAIIAGLAGAYVVRQRLYQPPPALPELTAAEADSIIIPVAAVDLVPGQMLTLNDVAILRLSPEKFAKSPFVKQAYMRSRRRFRIAC